MTTTPTSAVPSAVDMGQRPGHHDGGPLVPGEMSGRLAAATAELAKLLRRAPTASELAAAVSMSRDEVIDVLVVGDVCQRPPDDGLGSRGASACARNLAEWDANLDRIRDREAIRPLLAEMPEDERTVVVLRFFASLTQTQIADRLGIPPVRVARLLATALKQLRDQLQGSAAASQFA